MQTPQYPELYRPYAIKGSDYQMGASSRIITGIDGNQTAVICIQRLPAEQPASDPLRNHGDHSKPV